MSTENIRGTDTLTMILSLARFIWSMPLLRAVSFGIAVILLLSSGLMMLRPSSGYNAAMNYAIDNGAVGWCLGEQQETSDTLITVPVTWLTLQHEEHSAIVTSSTVNDSVLSVDERAQVKECKAEDWTLMDSLNAPSGLRGKPALSSGYQAYMQGESSVPSSDPTGPRTLRSDPTE